MLEEIVRHSRNGLLIDTNLLLVLIVGELGPQWLAKHDKINTYNISDYVFLTMLTQRCRGRLISTPHILAEVSNLAVRSINGDARTKVSEILQLLVTNHLDEQQVPSKEAVSHPHFSRFGITDCGILLLKTRKYAVITADAALHSVLSHEGITSYNYNNFRLGYPLA